MKESPYKITLHQAQELINAYYEKLINVPDPQVPNIIGGTIKKDLLLKQRDFINSLKGGTELYEGLVAWFCWTTKPEFFLSFEISDGIVIDENETVRPDMSKLARPIELIRVNKNTTINDLIINLDKINFDHDSEIERGNRYEEVDKALSLIKNYQESGPKGADKLPYNPFPYGFFENKKYSDVDDFLNQDPTYIRYYFGFDKTKTVNKIRVILIGVNSDGVNMLPKNPNEVIGGEAIILQKSWPPPE